MSSYKASEKIGIQKYILKTKLDIHMPINYCNKVTVGKRCETLDMEMNGKNKN